MAAPAADAEPARPQRLPQARRPRPGLLRWRRTAVCGIAPPSGQSASSLRSSPDVESHAPLTHTAHTARLISRRASKGPGTFMLLPEGEFLERRWSHSVEALVPGCRDLGRFDASFHTAAGHSNPCVPRRSWAIIRRRTVLLSWPRTESCRRFASRWPCDWRAGGGATRDPAGSMEGWGWEASRDSRRGRGGWR